MSSDKTVAIIDGSGVLADPAGLNREELIRLAKLRVPVAHFDKSKLGKDGYLVKVEEHDVKLPCKRCLPHSVTPHIDRQLSRRTRPRRHRLQERSPSKIQSGSLCSMWWAVSPGVSSTCVNSMTDARFPRSPEAVNISNMAALVDADGKPHFKYIVEGANLFLTQQARLHLEKRKVILFKDSSTNKGESLLAFSPPFRTTDTG